MGNIIGSAVVPVAMAILYEKANGFWCTAAAIIGLCAAIFAWIMKTSIDSKDTGMPTTILYCTASAQGNTASVYSK